MGDDFLVIKETVFSDEPQRCLVVDDHPEFLALLTDFLPTEYQAIAECANGQEALLQYGALRPDCVIMDVEMPIMDGLTATRLICEQFPAARVVVLTQYEDPEIRDAAFDAGACAFLGKDRLDHLAALLRERCTPSQETPAFQ